MKAIRVIKEVKDRCVSIDVPQDFGSNVEVIILPLEKDFEFWSEGEIKKMGNTSRMQKDIDNEDYSEW
jgi:hypothetical protein